MFHQCNNSDVSSKATKKLIKKKKKWLDEPDPLQLEELSFAYFLSIHLSLAALGPHCCARAFSSCGERGATHCGVFSCGGAQALGTRASGVVALTSCGAQAYLLRVPCTGRRILNHCNTREVPA